MTRIPDGKLHLFLHTTRGAADMAWAGHAELGFLSLRFGLKLAEADREAGDPGAEELVRRYEEALAAYTARYGRGGRAGRPCRLRKAAPLAPRTKKGTGPRGRSALTE